MFGVDTQLPSLTAPVEAVNEREIRNRMAQQSRQSSEIQGEGSRMECDLRTTYFRDQASRTRSTGLSFLPKVVTEYSTRTGISANISRLINPSRSNSRNCCVRTFCEMRGMFWRRPLNRSDLRDPMSHQRITGFHLPPISTSSSSIGHLLAMRLALIDLR